MVLQSKRVDLQVTCPLCHNMPEDDFHALVSCPLARAVWSITSLRSSIAAVSIIDWWNSIAINQEPKDIEITVSVMWSIWQNRNNVILNGQCSPAIRLYFSALDLHSLWHTAHLLQSVHTPITERFWHKPTRNILKCNVDAAILPNPPHVGFGSILRDHHGIVIASSQGRIHGLQNPATSEALAIREALSWLKNFNFFSIIVESDSLVIIDALNHSVADRSPLVFSLKIVNSLLKELHLVLLFLPVDQRIKPLTLWLERLLLCLIL
ncbi:uncharacterized protein [Henckelia pumila]|uniref:uncharacterized protein n=1 Tax=Henckelia pumila TaxID=405737 RepID=UPI003C6E6B1C